MHEYEDLGKDYNHGSMARYSVPGGWVYLHNTLTDSAVGVFVPFPGSLIPDSDRCNAHDGARGRCLYAENHEMPHKFPGHHYRSSPPQED